MDSDLNERERERERERENAKTDNGRQKEGLCKKENDKEIEMVENAEGRRI